jgi:hypothetical protein
MRTVGIALLVSLAAACTLPTGATGNGSGGAAPTAADGGAPVASGISCAKVVECIGACANADSTCENACIAKGTDAAKTKVNALSTCITKNGCNDRSCVDASCKTEYDACANDTAPQAAPAGGQGSIPVDLVGHWVASGGDAVIQYTFAADGSYSELSGLGGGFDNCPITNTWSINGTVNFDAQTVTFHKVSGLHTSKTCSSPETQEPITPEAETKSWKMEGGQLYTWQADQCQDPETCAVKFTKQ